MLGKLRGGGQLDLRDQLALVQGIVDFGTVPGQPVELGEWNASGTSGGLDVHHRVQRSERDAHV
ncbi:hypothetical protein D3C71_1661360 [compost metagenome]